MVGLKMKYAIKKPKSSPPTNPNKPIERKDAENILKVTTQKLTEESKAEVEKEEF